MSKMENLRSLSANPTAESTPLNVIRTETVLSKLPIHNLSKKGHVEIRITRKNSGNRFNLYWEVTYNSKYGQPRQMAYKLDTIVINRRLDEEGRPVPKWLRLGSLTQICHHLGVKPNGKNMANIKRAILQNAGSMISAKLNYRTITGGERHLEAVFTRYSVVFTGETLPDGRSADGVYLILTDPYREVLINAPVRPLNYDYLKELTPAAQRFYEIISYRIFAALKYRRPYARLSYSDYCTYSAQQRYYDYEHFKKQMYKIHRPHLQSGYLKSLHYEAAVDADNQPDWMMFYVPGPRAVSEFASFEAKFAPGQTLEASALIENSGDAASGDGTEQSTASGESKDTGTSIRDEMLARGISAKQANRLLQSLREGQDVLAQLEWGDYLIEQGGSAKIYNPPGFYVYLLREDVTPPESFLAQRERSEHARHDGGQQELFAADPDVETRFAEFRQKQIHKFIGTNLTATGYVQLVEKKRRELAGRYKIAALWDKGTMAEVAERAVAADIAKQIELPTIEEFSRGTM